MRWLPLFALASLFTACTPGASQAEEPRDVEGIPASATEGTHGVALLAGGCFWCLESAFDPLEGVISAVSGYAGGTVEKPSYKQVGKGGTGHVEVVRVVYDTSKLDYRKVLDVFWRNVDPFDGRGQFCDRGDVYRPAVFALDAEQKAIAEETKAAIEAKFKKTVGAKVEDAAVFWPAEEYHQDFWQKNEVHYLRYRTGCGRDRRLKEIWGAGGH